MIQGDSCRCRIRRIAPADENPEVIRHDIVRHGQVRGGHRRSDGGDVDAIVLLKDDHKAVEKLFKEFEKAGDRAVKTKRRLVDQMIKELTVHAYIEEQLFYPAARAAAPGTTGHVLESIEEHHVVVWMLSELSGMDPADERFTAKVTVLIENVRHHVEEEEQDWFPQVRNAMGRKVLQQLGEEMAAAKTTAPADPLSNLSARA
jgi:hemerythrin superfamily protein